MRDIDHASPGATRPNALDPDLMTARERLAEACGILALGLVRLRQRDRDHAAAERGELCLHNSADRRLHATPTQEDTA